MSNSIKERQQAKRQQEDAILNRILIWFGSAVLVEIVLLLLNRFWAGFAPARWLIALVPAVAVLALVYYLYQQDFFGISLLSAGGILSMLLYRRMILPHPFRIRCGFGLAFVLLIAAVVLIALLQKTGGRLPSHNKRILPADANYPLLYITCALNAVLLALTLALGSTAAYYLLFVLVGWLFVMAVYYTVKLM